MKWKLEKEAKLMNRKGILASLLFNYFLPSTSKCVLEGMALGEPGTTASQVIAHRLISLSHSFPLRFVVKFLP